MSGLFEIFSIYLKFEKRFYRREFKDEPPIFGKAYWGIFDFSITVFVNASGNEIDKKIKI
jgi:hypothetical protein